MKAITLYEPWATLMAIGAKVIETRSWPIPPALIGEPIAIHAASKWTINTLNGGPGQWVTSLSHPFVDALFPSSLNRIALRNVKNFLPPTLGHVLAVVRFVACPPTTILKPETLANGVPITAIVQPHPQLVSFIEGTNGHLELSFGDFSRGRFAWITDASTTKLEQPVRARGGQRIWNLTGAAERQVKAQL